MYVYVCTYTSCQLSCWLVDVNRAHVLRYDVQVYYVICVRALVMFAGSMPQSRSYNVLEIWCSEVVESMVICSDFFALIN